MTDATIEIIEIPPEACIDATDLVESEIAIEDDDEIYEEIIVLDLRALAAADRALC
jgi:hypothetical protein